MNNFPVKAGDVVVTQFSAYQHWALVSGRICPLGKNMLISAKKKDTELIICNKPFKARGQDPLF